MKAQKKRIDIIDALRGFAVALMVIHHAFYNAWAFLDAPLWLYRNPIFNILQIIFIGVFVAVSGVSSRFSKGNVERGAIVLVIAVIISYITTQMEMPIIFGILHLLGFLMMFYGITRKFWDNIPRKVAPFIYIILIVVSALVRAFLSPSFDNIEMHNALHNILNDVLSVLGWRQPGFVTFDYQPILPWIFVFLFGTWIGEYIRENKFPSWFYEVKVPFFPVIGRNALLIYIAHQPILVGITIGIAHLLASSA
ncbi:MAG: DUF1624 domain-containing protein [Oscillospiraceae bacterium]|nr:DUF1624 domain-containing protein [Oscillospiraceae bacterium]